MLDLPLRRVRARRAGRARVGEVGRRIHTQTSFKFGSVEQRLEHLHPRGMGIADESCVEHDDCLGIVAAGVPLGVRRCRSRPDGRSAGSFSGVGSTVLARYTKTARDIGA